MRYFLILLTFFVLTACEKPQLHKPFIINQERQSAVNAVRKQAANRIYKQIGLIPIGFGGRTSNGVEMLALSFQYNKSIDIEEGRKLVINAVDTLVQTVNSDAAIQPFIKNPPFEVKNVEIRIFLRNSDQSSISQGNLCIISAINGELEYDIHSLKNNDLITLYEETYEEAVLKSRIRE